MTVLLNNIRSTKKNRLHILNNREAYYYYYYYERPSSSSSLRNRPETEEKMKLEGNDFKVTGKSSILVWNNGKFAKDHPSCYSMRSNRDVHKSWPGGTDQVIQHVRGIFQGIRQGPNLASSCYAASEGEVDPPAPWRRGHRHGEKQLGQQR